MKIRSNTFRAIPLPNGQHALVVPVPCLYLDQTFPLKGLLDDSLCHAWGKQFLRTQADPVVRASNIAPFSHATIPMLSSAGRQPFAKKGPFWIPVVYDEGWNYLNCPPFVLMEMRASGSSVDYNSYEEPGLPACNENFLFRLEALA
jgi:hypothetical protein